MVLTEGIEPAGTLATLFHKIGHYKLNHFGNGDGKEIAEGQAEFFCTLDQNILGLILTRIQAHTSIITLRP
jgi:hypothetical protein